MFPFDLSHAFLSACLSATPRAAEWGHVRPEKFDAREGLYSSTSDAPLVIFALPHRKTPKLDATVEIPSMLSLLAFGNPDVEIKGISAFPRENRPPLWITFVSFHNMVLLGTW